MELQYSVEGSIGRIKLTGHFSRLSEHRHVYDKLAECKDLNTISINLAEIAYADSAFPDFLVTVKKKLPALIDKIELLNPSPSIAYLLEITQLDRVFTVRHTGEKVY